MTEGIDTRQMVSDGDGDDDFDSLGPLNQQNVSFRHFNRDPIQCGSEHGEGNLSKEHCDHRTSIK